MELLLLAIGLLIFEDLENDEDDEDDEDKE